MTTRHRNYDEKKHFFTFKRPLHIITRAIIIEQPAHHTQKAARNAVESAEQR